MKMKKFFALLLCLLCLMSIAAPVYATDAEVLASGLTVYPENETFLRRNRTSARSTGENNSWATFDINTAKNAANIRLHSGDFTYNFTVSGYAERVGNGYIGCYKGVFIPDAADTDYASLVLPGNAGVLVAVNATFCGDSTFFTLVIGEISETTEPIVKAYGVYDSAIDSVERAYSSAIIAAQESERTTNVAAASVASTRAVAAEVTFQKSVDFTVGGLKLGEMSLFFANEQKNQLPADYFVKLNTNTTNAVSYARDYFDISDSDVVVAQPTYFYAKILSSYDKLYVRSGDWSPATGSSTVTFTIPYYIPNTGLAGTVDVPVTTSSVTATPKTPATIGYRAVEWAARSTYGFSGTNGTYLSQSGMAFNAYYTHASSATENYNATITATGKIEYLIISEDSTFLTQHTYTLTLSQKTVSDVVVLLPD